MRLAFYNIATFAKIGFIGLGNMGFPMACNLSKNGHQVYGFDIETSKEAEAIKHNVIFRKEVKQICKDADVFVTMLPNSAHSKETCEAKGGIFLNAPKGSLIIDCSTISPMVAVELNTKAKTHQMTFVDAPVSGGVTGAAASTLTFMVGAESQAIFNRVKPFLQGMGKNIFNCQKSGAGQIAKVCNNMALAIEMIGISQALAMGAKLGMDSKILTNIMKVSSSRCWSVDTSNPVPGVMENVPASRNYERGFACELMLKDLGLALEAAKEVNCDAQLGNLSKDIYTKLVKEGHGKKDFGVIYDKLVKK